MEELLTAEMLPDGFEYPADFLRLVEQGITDLTPWHVLSGERLRLRRIGLLERYPGRDLVPFARRQDNDDLACWEGTDAGRVRTIHDFASPGWEERRGHTAFWDWFRAAIEDMIAFDP
jgi:hypothetical protein